MLVVVVVALVVCGAPIALGWRTFEVIFDSFPYHFHSEILNGKLEIQNKTGDTYLDIALEVHEDLDNIYLQYAIALDLGESNNTTLVNRTINYCKFLKQHSMEPLLRIIYEDLLKQGNFIKRCPVKKGNYTVRGYRIDEETLPSYVPEAKFLADFKLLHTNGQVLFEGQLHGKIDKSKGFNNFKSFSLG
ncbi:PREDICTED: uncharacterized protein LOC108379282 isoform X1 [Rhagoletis zephyria]|uniref:uncharacterized protein LOC108379282 isoform X1 n=1 Tax=Rhagoletis zephyria TaxID=28612 RepID=UPI00081170F5|nr:PREDICTED: uncharacterized protein LOC108379282 isoform X1 [Rhagoletis zephyria]